MSQLLPDLLPDSRSRTNQDDLQEVASFRPCQRPCGFNLMHPSMSFEAQTHRPMPCGCDTYTNRPNLSRDDWSESNRDASLDGDPDSDRHSKEETPCPNSSGTSAKDMDACTFSLASHWIQAVATSSLATLILSSFDTNPVSRHGPLDRPSPQHAVDFGIGPLSPSSLSSHRSTRLVRPFCSPPTHQNIPISSGRSADHPQRHPRAFALRAANYNTSDAPVQLPRAGCRPPLFSHGPRPASDSNYIVLRSSATGLQMPI